MLVSRTLRPGSFRNSTCGQFSYFHVLIPNLLKIFDITRDFDSAEEYSSIVQKMQHKDNKAIAVCSWITTKIWFPFQMSLCHWSGWLKPAHTCSRIWSLFCRFLSFYISMLDWVTCTLLLWCSTCLRMTPTPFWLTYGRTFTQHIDPFNFQSHWLNQKPTSCPLCVGVNSAFFTTAMVLWSSLGLKNTSLSISSGSSSIVGFHWSVIVDVTWPLVILQLFLQTEEKNYVKIDAL